MSEHKIIGYEHHGVNVSVREDLKGKHREHCLCYRCRKFNPGKPETNCPIANLLYAVCLAQNVVTPVWECSQFAEGEMMVEPVPPPLEDISEADVSPDEEMV
jgi:hypothetical protein